MCIFRVENFIGGGAEMDPKSGGPIIENDICPPPSPRAAARTHYGVKRYSR